MGSIFERIKNVDYKDVVVDVPFNVLQEEGEPELVFQVEVLAPGMAVALTQKVIDNLHKREIFALPGSLPFATEEANLLFDRLPELIKGWTHKPPEGEPVEPFSEGLLKELFSADYTVWQKLRLINAYRDAIKKTESSGKDELGNEELAAGS